MIEIAVFVVFVCLLLVFLIPPEQIQVLASEPTFPIGLSSYPIDTENLVNVIELMDYNGLNTHRLSFNPEWFTNKPRPYNASIVQYVLDNSNHMVIVDRNHLYPPTQSSASSAKKNWDLVRNSTFEVLAAWPNNSRVAVELINEYISKDFYPLMQQLISDIRDAGYTNPIVVNKCDQPWTKLDDPLDNTFQGYHFYFNYWSVSGAILQMKIALSRGIKIINTEVGADSRESRYFTVDTVNELNDFLNQSASLGVGNCVWMVERLSNWAAYQSLGLTFPVDSQANTLYDILLS